MKGSFVDFRLGGVPPWIAGPTGAAIQVALGNDQNAHVAGLEDTVKMSSPFLCASDALDAVGRRLGLVRYPGEPNGTAPIGSSAGTGYRGRLCGAWDAWSWAGTSKAVTDQLVAYGIPNVSVTTDDAITFYASHYFSRFDVTLGPNFGTLAVSRSCIAPLVATTIVGSFGVPPVGTPGTVQIDGNPFVAGNVVYIGNGGNGPAGWFSTGNSTGGFTAFTNLGSAAAACSLLGLLPGTLGAGVNAAPGTTVNVGAMIVMAYTGAIVTGGTPALIGPGAAGTPIGFQFANAADRQAVKSIILKWKSDHGYPGRIVLLWDAQAHTSAWPFSTGSTYIGRMIGLNIWIGTTPIGGYDRS